MSPTRILILGATGVSGLAFIPIALRSSQPTSVNAACAVTNQASCGHREAGAHRRGSLTDQDALLRAMEGVDIVISVLGADRSLQAFVLRTKTTVFTVPLAFSFWLVQLLASPIGDTFPGILSAMRTKGVKRIFALSTPSFSPNPSEVYSYLGSAYVLLAKVVGKAADLPVTAGHWPDHKDSFDLSRASMAVWILKEIEGRQWAKKAPMLGNY
ncbi:hypothetical protein B0H14DRAFT_3581173 [Mycena olivaceomarginata]|nr:hypothetical protein B0H14DRAFT_3581173 [Mycena olivaceomarginata]